MYTELPQKEYFSRSCKLVAHGPHLEHRLVLFGLHRVLKKASANIQKSYDCNSFKNWISNLSWKTKTLQYGASIPSWDHFRKLPGDQVHATQLVHCSCPHSQGVDVYSYLSLCFLMLSSGIPQKREFPSFVVQFLAEKKEKWTKVRSLWKLT